MIIVGVLLGRVSVIVGQSVLMLLKGNEVLCGGIDDLALKGRQKMDREGCDTKPTVIRRRRQTDRG